MSYSPLACKFIPAHTNNYTKGRRDKISEICIHYMAGNCSIETCGQIWQNPNRQGSSTYGIGSDGRIACYVDENDTAWCNSNWDSNCRSVSIETANLQPSPNVTDQALNSLIKLVADVAKRNGMGKLVKGKNVTWHSMYTSTSCPGSYLLSKMDYIVEQANKINFKEYKIKYRGYVQDIGWQKWVGDGELAGTEHQSKRMEAIQIDYKGDVYAKAHIQDKGWIDYGKITKDTVIGTMHESLRLEALCLKGNFKYRVHIQESGWSCWTKADGICTLGSVGQGLRIEAIEIKEL